MNQQTQKIDPTDPLSTTADWHPSFVVAALHQAGWTMTNLAKHHNLKGIGTLSKALRISLPIAEQRIADAIGVHPKVIWPSRYYENGDAKLRGFRALQSTPPSRTVNGES
jgi:Ner family transcriptional regulator